MWTKGRRRRALLTLLVLGAAVCSASFFKPQSDLKVGSSLFARLQSQGLIVRSRVPR